MFNDNATLQGACETSHILTVNAIVQLQLNITDDPTFKQVNAQQLWAIKNILICVNGVYNSTREHDEDRESWKAILGVAIEQMNSNLDAMLDAFTILRDAPTAASHVAAAMDWNHRPTPPREADAHQSRMHLLASTLLRLRGPGDRVDVGYTDLTTQQARTLAKLLLTLEPSDTAACETISALKTSQQSIYSAPHSWMAIWEEHQADVTLHCPPAGSRLAL